eukprot:TRINITY_DN2610_c0_g2_i1.p1 TRINITY_DN2610_c0_g2~~TRINITY_DN2610_c0_g2_i1.p1  ORF type:complete len:199 (+),score=25.13 TRINITY_DN2610_c0_g2_i1:45-599(+)
MEEADDLIPERIFDNFQFVNFTNVALGNETWERKEARIAHDVLLEIPDQYQKIRQLGLLGRCGPSVQYSPVLPPPNRVLAADEARLSAVTGPPQSMAPSAPPLPPDLIYEPSAPLNNYRQYEHPLAFPPNSPPQLHESQLCPMCNVAAKDLALGCGHQMCEGCGQFASTCPVCHTVIDLKVRLQ